MEKTNKKGMKSWVKRMLIILLAVVITAMII